MNQPTIPQSQASYSLRAEDFVGGGPMLPAIPSSFVAEAEPSLRILLPAVGWQDTESSSHFEVAPVYFILKPSEFFFKPY